MASSITLHAERQVAAPLQAVRTALGQAMRQAGMTVKAEQLTLIEASRGSQLAAAAMQMRKLPLMATLRIASDGARCTVSVELADRWKSPLGRTWGANGLYRKAYEEILGAIDGALAGLDPAGAAAFAAGQFHSKTRDIAPLEGANAVTAKAGNALADKTTRALEGDRHRGDAPKAWKGVGRVTLLGPKGAAELDLSDMQGMLTAGAHVLSQPGTLPPPLMAQVERFVARVEAELSAGDEAMPERRVELAPAEVPVVEFLRQQARIREQVPLRTLQVCTTCRLEKVVNPDYKRLMTKNHRIRTLTGSLGLFFSPAGVSPYVLVGRLVQLKQLDPDFVCNRCQGLEADASVVTFCPTCGERRGEAALRVCGRCKHDFRTALEDEVLWHEQHDAPPALPAPAPERAALGAGEAPALPAGTLPPAGWHRDPFGRHELRWWDGTAWSAHVRDAAPADPGHTHTHSPAAG
jgi:hypothetical protein